VSEESVAIAALDRRVSKVEDGIEPVQKLLASRHTHGNKLQELAAALDILEIKAGTMEREVAVVQTELSGLQGTVETGFQDLKTVMKTTATARAEQDAADRERQHELSIQGAKDAQIWWGKVFALVGTVLTLAGGGGGALYAMSGDEPAERPPVAAPVVP
jgi:predicted  nucleic acid-binding Zn-ribbon protein